MQDAQGISPGSEGGPHHKRPGGPGTDLQRPRGDGSGGITAHADNFQIHLFGCLAAQEREFISQRTRAALAAAKARGIQLGNPRLAEINRTRKQAARKFADQHSNLIWSLRNKGRTLREICEVLNDAGITTAKGGVFHPVQVSRILQRSTNPVLAAA